MDTSLIILILLSGAYALPASFKSCDCVCGVRGRNNRIVGGKETDTNEYPWMVGLFRGNRLYCGGAIVSDRHVLTAAHCVHPFKKSEIKVYLGGHNISTDYVDTRRVRRIHEHENFDPVSFDFDIALLELDKAVLFGSKIQPACLPDEQLKDYSGKVAVIAGWGRLGEQEQTSNTLRQVIVPIWSKEECLASDYGAKRLTDNMMCAGYQDGGSDACQGDSGGPMNFEGQTGSLQVIGLVSWGRGCARKKLPGIYTRVSNFLPWIQKKLNGQCLCKPKEGVRSNFLELLAEHNRV